MSAVIQRLTRFWRAFKAALLEPEPWFTVYLIPHNQQQYNTIGDYYGEASPWRFYITRFADLDYSACVVLHEFTERYLMFKRGIPEAAVTAFDLQYEEERKAGLHHDEDEPGHDKRCPCHAEHCCAEVIERMFLRMAGGSWDAYDKAALQLMAAYPKK